MGAAEDGAGLGASPPGQQPHSSSSSSGGGGGGGGGSASMPPFSADSPEPPPEFIDPISDEVMLDPVMLLETGQTYERSSILRWFQTCQPGRCTDPLTGTVLESIEVRPNFALRGLITAWAERHRIRDLHSFSREHSPLLKRLNSALNRVQLSPPRAATARPASAPAAGAGGAAASASNAAAPAPAGADSPPLPPVGAADARPRRGSGASAATPHPSGSGASANYPSLYGAPPQPPPESLQPPQASPTHAAELAAAAAADARGVYPSAARPARTSGDRLRDAAASLAALQPAALVAGGKGAAAYHAWTLMQLATVAECRERMLQGRVIPLAVYLLGQPGLEDVKPSLAGLLQRLAVAGPAVAVDIHTAGGVHALALLAGASEDRGVRVAAANSLYFMGFLGEQIRGTAAAALAQQAAQQQLPPNPLYTLWRFWEELPPRLPPRPTPPVPQQPPANSGPEGDVAEERVVLPPPQSRPIALASPEQQGEWEALAYVTHMLSSGPGAGAPAPPGSTDGALDVRATGLPLVLTHVAVGGGSGEAAQYAALSALHALMRVPQNRGPLLAALLEALGGGDWDAAGRAAGVLWELCYDETTGNSFPMLQALHAAPQFVPALSSALARPLPALRRPAAGLLACVLFDGAGMASGRSSAAAVDSQRYLMVDGWRQALLAPGAATAALLVESARDAAADPVLAQLALTALANLAAARGTAAASGPAAPPQPKASAFDKMKAKLEGKLLAGGGASFNRHHPHPHPPRPHEEKPVAPGPRGALLSHDLLIPTLLHLVLNPAASPPAPLLLGEGGAPLGAPAGGSGTWGSGSFASISPPETPCSATSHASFSFTPIGQLPGGGGASGEAQALARMLLPPTLLALGNLVTEQAGREQVRAFAKGAPGRQAQLHAALNAAMANRQLPLQAQELARRLLHELSSVPGPLSTALGGRAVPPPPRAAAYPTP